MATILICNNDVQSALRALKKEMQKEGVFRIAKGKKTFKNNHELAIERNNEIIRRKIKDKHEAKADSAYSGVSEQKPKPFVFKLQGYNIKIYDDGRTIIFVKNKKVFEAMLDKVDFDDIEKLVKTASVHLKKEQKKEEVVKEATEE